MILVVLGTQDKDFSRLLKAVDKEINNGNIKDEVIVQAGQTKYQSDNMKIFDLLPAPEFEKLVDEADLIITHGGAGTILGAIKKGKKVIAVARLAEYGEHHNDHQKQIIGEFSKQGYILELKDFDKLADMIKESKRFKPKKFKSNTKNMIKLLDNYIEDSDNISFYNRHFNVISSFILGILDLLLFLLFRLFMPVYISCFFSLLIISFLLYFIYDKCFSILLFFLINIGLFYLFIDKVSINSFYSKIMVNIILILLMCIGGYYESK